MRPQIVSSVAPSLIRLSTRAFTSSSRPLALSPRASVASSVSITSPHRLFTTRPALQKLVKPQEKTATSDQNINITSPNSVTMSSNISASVVLENIKNRRTYYALNKDLVISKDRIQEIVKEAVLHVPSSFNSQSNRAIVLFGDEHDKLWNITEAILKTIVPEDSWQPTADRIAGFRNGAASVLFFEDQDVVNKFQENIPLYADKFPIWASQSDGMLQYAVWTALEAEGLGANLQHYNPLIDQKVASEWNVPTSWKLNAQLVIGGRAGEPGPKEFQPIEERFKAYGA